MNYLNRALDLFNTAVVSPIYYVLFTTLTVLAEAIMYDELGGLGGVQKLSELSGFTTVFVGVFLLHASSTPESVEKLLLSPSASCLRASKSQMP